MIKKDLTAFKIQVGNKVLDYREPGKLNLEVVKEFFSKKYKVNKIWAEGRHVLGELDKSGVDLFLKLSTTEGISEVSKVEFDWNEAFNKQVERQASKFWVPKNYESGVYKNLFYSIADKLEGEFLTPRPKNGAVTKLLEESILEVIEFSEVIQSLEFPDLNDRFFTKGSYIDWFVEKTRSWLDSTPGKVVNEYKVGDLMKIVENNSSRLKMKPRHGDFTPWHIMKMKIGQLALLDGERSKAKGVEGYDIGYFIQRVFTILERPDIAERILDLLLEGNYKIEKLKVILAARAIGGFLDESFDISPTYTFEDKFKEWVINL
jgi:hypothetical protein